MPGEDQPVEDSNRDQVNSLGDHQGLSPDQQPDKSANLDPAGPRKPSRMALRRRRIRAFRKEERKERERAGGPSQQSKRQSRKEGRVREAQDRTVKPDDNLSSGSYHPQLGSGTALSAITMS